MIDVKHLSKSFGDHLVLDDISEHIHPQEKVVIIGPSGSGKSTFLRCLNLLETPTKGSITFGSLPPVRFHASDRHRRYGGQHGSYATGLLQTHLYPCATHRLSGKYNVYHH